jgi:YgiT-type zinc finger domain-containing protein
MSESCRNLGCPGHYEEERITEALRFPDGRVIVIEDIPALVCDFCGDTLLEPDAAEELERIKAGAAPPIGSVPLYRYGSAAALVPAGASDEGAVSPVHGDVGPER